MGRNGAQEILHQIDVHHRTFVDDQDIGIQGSRFVSLKTSLFRIDFEETVDCFCGSACGFGHPLGSSACRGAEKEFDLLGFKDTEDGLNQGGFAYTGTAGDDGGAMFDYGFKGFYLLFREFDTEFVLHPGNGFWDIDVGIVGWFRGDGVESFRDGAFGVQECGKVDERSGRAFQE